jgi:tetratricopeptide (TPR) repeat protein
MKTHGILGPMPAVELEEETVREELGRVLKSHGFARNERLSHFLRFLVEQHIEGRDGELKESVIGIEVFGRAPGYNPKDDPIVRTEARRLRARLAGYYEGTGAADAAVIELPKGGYVPVVRLVSPVSVTAVTPALMAPARGWLIGRRLAAAAFVGLAVLLAAVGWTLLGSRGGLRYKANGEVYNLYLRARAFEAQPSLSGIDSGIDLFRQAIAKDPSFARAYAGIAAGCAARAGFDGFDASGRADTIAEGWAAAGRAIQLDARSADAHDALGMMQALQSQWEQSERSFRRAIEFAPRDVLWRDHFAMYLLLPLGRVEEAIHQLRVAEELDPLSAETHNELSLALRSADRHEEALSHCQQAAVNDRQRSVCWAQILQHQGKNEEALRVVEAAWSGHILEPGGHILGIAYAKAGRREDAERLAAMLPRLASKAQIFAALGDKDRTFETLDRMAPMGPARIGRDFLISPNFAFLRGDRRLGALRKKVGLPE